MKIKDILKEISFNTSAAAISGDEGISDHSPRFNIKQSCSFKKSIHKENKPKYSSKKSNNKPFGRSDIYYFLWLE